MRERSKESPINAHFRREAMIPAAIMGAIIVATLVMAFVGPWLFERLR